MIPQRISPSEIRHINCLHETLFLDQASIETAQMAVFGGNAKITTETLQRFQRVGLFDGTGDFINFGNRHPLNILVGDFTLEMGIKTTDTAGVIFGKRNGAGNGWRVETIAGPQIQLSIDDGTAVSGSQSTNLTDAYHHIMIVGDRSGNATFYLDGAADGTFDISGSAGTLINTVNSYIGVDGDGSGTPFNGRIFMVAKWDRLLTAAEALQRAAMFGFGSGFAPNLERGLISYWPLGNIQGTVVADKVGSNNGTATSLDESDVVTGYNNVRNALGFDGSADLVTVTTVSEISDIFDGGGSISFWINSVSAGESNAGRIYDKGQTVLFLRSPSAGANKMRLIKVFTSGNGQWDTSNRDIIDGLWTHVVVTYNDNSLDNDVAYYINGKSVAVTEVLTPGGTAVSDSTTNLVIGNRAAADRTFDGSIQDVMTYDSELTQLEIELLYNNQLRGRRI